MRRERGAPAGPRSASSPRRGDHRATGAGSRGGTAPASGTWRFGCAVRGDPRAGHAAHRPDGAIHVIALDIGQGDAILVIAPDGTTMLVDGGPDPERTLRELGRALPSIGARSTCSCSPIPTRTMSPASSTCWAAIACGRSSIPGVPFDNPTYGRFQADAAREPGATLLLGGPG